MLMITPHFACAIIDTDADFLRRLILLSSLRRCFHALFSRQAVIFLSRRRHFLSPLMIFIDAMLLIQDAMLLLKRRRHYAMAITATPCLRLYFYIDAMLYLMIIYIFIIYIYISPLIIFFITSLPFHLLIG